MAGNYYQILNKAATRNVELDHQGTIQIVDEGKHQVVSLEPQEATELFDFLLLHLEEIRAAIKRKE